MINRTDYNALEYLKKIYKDQIVDYKYKVWKESYLAPPPKKAFCTGITRYRKCMKITHVILKDGRYIPVGSSGCLIYLIIIILTIFTSLLYIFLL